MFWTQHLADHELLLTGDDNTHLARCSQCQDRRNVLTQALDRLSDACSRLELPPLPSADAARARLQMQLTAVTPQSVTAPLFTGAGQWGYAAGLAIVFATVVFLFSTNGALTPDRTPEAPRVFLLPHSDLTPGAIREAAVSDLCGARRNSPTAIPASVRERVFRAYGADTRRAGDYELDYLITPELGGTADERNLWPQPYSFTPWNAFVKDELERLLHDRVCDGTIDLAAAQQHMAGDWIAAYKQIFQTDKPLRDYQANPLTALDRDLLASELEEFGIAPPAPHADGTEILALFQAARQGRLGG